MVVDADVGDLGCFEQCHGVVGDACRDRDDDGGDGAGDAGDADDDCELCWWW